FWYTITKIKGCDSYKFLLANKECKVDVEVFRKILDICPRKEVDDFIKVQKDEDTLTFLVDLGYSRPLHKYKNMFVDHMRQPWRTLAACINKCLSGKNASNDKLRKSTTDILWGMFYRDNVDYPSLIWEDIAYQIDHRLEKKLRHKNMPHPRFTKFIIDYFLSKHKSLKKLKFQHFHTIKDDGVMIQLNLTKAEEEATAREVHDTHVRIVFEFVLKPARTRGSTSIAFRDTSIVSKKRTFDMYQKLKGTHTLSPTEQEAANILKYQHLQENFRDNKSQNSQEAPKFDTFFMIDNLEAQLQEKDNVIRNLKIQVSKMNDRSCETNSAKDVKALDSKNLELTDHVTALLEQNERFRGEIDNVKQHYKELYDSIKITRAHTNEKASSMLKEIESLKAQLKSKVSCITSDSVKPKVLAFSMYAIDVEPIPPHLKNNRNAHIDYVNYIKDSVETICEIVKEARIVKLLANELNSACKYTKLS
ncbi:hypothetical protein Tco_0593302, partial [Tanacetum coccineum]